MRSAASSLVLVLVSVFGLGCSGRMVAPPADSGVVPQEDGGVMTMDGGTEEDSGLPPDDSGLPVDSGPPDSGPPPCACPAFPTTCTAPVADTPTFTPSGGMIEQLFDVIACADSTLEIAIYEAEWDCISGAIEAQLARDPDLTVRVVVDDDNCGPGSCVIDEITPADRVTVVRDDRSGLMHHKWVIADGARLWVGSANWTERSFCVDHNDALVIEQPEIVARYREIFERMATEGTFGPVAPEEPTTAGAYTVYFSPESPTTMAPAWLTAMVAAIDGAVTEVDVLTNAWTRTEISDALVRAHMRGVRVRAVVSHLYADDAPAQALLAAGIDVRRDNVHDKVLVVDAEVVVTGSANWSRNAWSNNENSLWIADPGVAGIFAAEVGVVHGAARPVEAM